MKQKIETFSSYADDISESISLVKDISALQESVYIDSAEKLFPFPVAALVNKFPDSKKYIYKTRNKAISLKNPKFPKWELQVDKEIMKIYGMRKPEQALENHYLYKGAPYARETVYNAVYNDIWLQWEKILKYLSVFSKEAYASEYVFTIGTQYPWKLMEHTVDFKNTWYAFDSINRIISISPNSVIAYYLAYQDMPRAKNVLTILLDKNPKSLIWYYDRYDDKEILQIAFEKVLQDDPLYVLKKLWTPSWKYLSQPLEKAMVKKSFMFCIVSNPEFILDHFYRYEELLENEEVHKLTIESVIAKHPEYIVTGDYKWWLEDFFGWVATEQYESAVSSLLENNPWLILVYFSRIKEKITNLKDVFVSALESSVTKNPRAVLTYVFDFNDIDLSADERKVFYDRARTIEAEKNPRGFLNSFDRYTRDLNPEEKKKMFIKLIKNGKEQSRTSITSYFERYPYDKKVQALFDELLLEIADKDPEYIPWLFEAFKHKSYAKELLLRVAKKSPKAFLEWFHLYRPQPYISDVIKVIPVEEMLFHYWVFKENHFEWFTVYHLLFKWLHAIKSIQLWSKKITLDPKKNINIYSWILKTYLNQSNWNLQNSTIDWYAIVVQYEKNINAFIEQWKNRSFSNKEHIFTTVARVSEQWWDDHNWAFSVYWKKVKEVYKWLWWAWFSDYSSNITVLEPSKIIDLFEKQILDSPNSYHIFHLWAHGGTSWEAETVWWEWSKDDFDRLFNLWVQFPDKVKIDITSCNSWTKDDNYADNTIDNLSLDSWLHPSYNYSDFIFLEAFKKVDQRWVRIADYDNDGEVNHNEALLYRAVEYSASLTPISFDNEWDRIDIVMEDVGNEWVRNKSDVW